jgi:uncharacterized protein YjbJ (UPF0337 family)
MIPKSGYRFSEKDHAPTKSTRANHLEEDTPMNWDQIEANWSLLQGKAREYWGRLTDEDVERSGGKRDALVRCIIERYRMTNEQAERHVDGWTRTLTRFRAA